jgi:sulfatase maturation enzyme AslB (radical SAM superfamily)
MFYHIDSASVCCVNQRRVKVSPDEFRNTDYVKNLQKQFEANIKPDSCISCWKAEEDGLQSIRQHMLKSKHELNNGYKHMELRASNLCNFHCIMCNAEDSSEIAKKVYSISDENWNQILEIAKGLKTLILTGGEPMLIKRYYELLDYLPENIRLIIYTNCSVFNPVFVEKMLKLKNVKLQLSLDGVKETAEFQRAGSNWNSVRKNAELFCSLPIEVSIHTTFTRFNLKDIVRFVAFLKELHNMNEKITFNAHTIMWPENMRVEHVPAEELSETINQLSIAIQQTEHSSFSSLRRELMSLKIKLQKRGIQ